MIDLIVIDFNANSIPCKALCMHGEMKLNMGSCLISIDCTDVMKIKDIDGFCRISIFESSNEVPFCWFDTESSLAASIYKLFVDTYHK